MKLLVAYQDKGTEIVVYINGHHLTTITDNTFAEGYVGVFVSASESDSQIAFDNFRVYSLD